MGSLSNFKDNWHHFLLLLFSFLCAPETTHSPSLQGGLPDIFGGEGLPNGLFVTPGNDYWWKTRSDLEPLYTVGNIQGVSYMIVVIPSTNTRPHKHPALYATVFEYSICGSPGYYIIPSLISFVSLCSRCCISELLLRLGLINAAYIRRSLTY